MRLDLRDMIHRPGAVKDFAYELDLSKVRHFGERPFSRLVKVSGAVRNAAGALELVGAAETDRKSVV